MGLLKNPEEVQNQFGNISGTRPRIPIPLIFNQFKQKRYLCTEANGLLTFC